MPSQSSHRVSLAPLEPGTAPLLKELLAIECLDWQELLLWDYRESADLILEVAERGELPGFVWHNEQSASGYCFWVPEGKRVLIGDLYLLPEQRGNGADAALVEAMLREIGRMRVARIESQNIGFGIEGAYRVYRKRGFTSYQRFFMLKSLTQSDAAPATEMTLEGQQLHFRPYHSNDFTPVARLIYESYVGRPDSEINSQYSTYAGCKEFLMNLIKSTGCGRFLRQQSVVAEVRGSKKIVGAIIATEISAGNAHLPQISVLSSLQGQGLGRRMIELVSVWLNRADYQTSSLAVSTANQPAVRLYQSCGFEMILDFPVFVKTF